MRHARHGSNRLIHRTALRLALAAGCAAALALGGCSDDPAEQALDNASVTLASLDVGVGTQIPPNESKARFNSVVSEMQPIASGGETYSADASVLLAMAQRGLALQSAAEVAEVERAALDIMPKLRAHLRAWVSHSAAADAEGEYDPAPELAQIDSDVRSRQQDIAAQQQAKADIQSNIDGLLGQVQELMSRAQGLRDQAGELRLRIPGVSATEGLELSEQIRALSRSADGLEFEARGLKSQADQLGLDVRAADLESEKLRTQVDLLGQSRLAVEGRASASRQVAADARGYAQEAADAIAALIENADTGLVSVRASIDGQYDDTLSKLSTASRSAQGGRTARRTSAQLAIGQVQQSIGDVQWARSMGLDAYASVMTELAAAAPALPNAAQYAERAVDATDASTEARRGAFDAYEAAVAAYESTGARGEAADLLQDTTNKLRELSGTVGDGVVDAAALDAMRDGIEDDRPDTTSSADADDTPAPSGGDPESEVRSAIAAAIEAAENGDAATAIAFLHPASDLEAEFIQPTGDMMVAFLDLDATTESAFGQRFSEWLEGMQPQEMMQMPGLAMLAGASGGLTPDQLLDAEIRVSGDEAVMLSPMPGQPDTTFRRIDGQWKQVLDLHAQAAATGQPAEIMASAMRTALPALTSAVRNGATGASDGSLQSNQAVGVQINTELMPVLMQLMSEMQGGG